jgi:light-regulated signal transduction histidine kinase (bacteriophytochrome)
VNLALDEALFLVHNQIALQNIALERDLAPVPPVRADFGQLRQAFANIIINACDAMPKGGALRVRSRALSDDHAVEVSIADTGVGIPREQLSKVLDPFFTTKDKGTGLGPLGRVRRRRATRRAAVDRQRARRGNHRHDQAAARLRRRASGHRAGGAGPWRGLSGPGHD